MCTVIWGGTFVILKDGLNNISPILFVALRFSLSALIFLPGFFLAYGKIHYRSLRAGGFLGILMFAGFALQTSGLEETSASRSAFITQMLVVFTPMFQFFFLRKSFEGGSIVGVIIVVLGLFLLTSPDASMLNRGDWATFLSALAFAAYIVALDYYTRHYDLSVLMFMQTLATAVLSWITSLLFEKIRLSYQPELILSLLYLSPVATNIIIYIQNRYQKETTPTRAALIFTMEPVWASLFAIVFLREFMNLRELTGAGLMVSGLIYSTLHSKIFRKYKS